MPTFGTRSANIGHFWLDSAKLEPILASFGPNSTNGDKSGSNSTELDHSFRGIDQH